MEKEKIKKLDRRKFLKGISSLALASGLGYLVGKAQAQTSSICLEPASLQTEASYIIFNDNGVIKARNGKTGNIDFPGTNASTVIQSVINALPQGGLIHFKKGDYELSTSLSIDLHPSPEVTPAGIGFVIEGEGPWTRIIGPPNGTNTLLYFYRSYADNFRLHKFTIRDLSITANSMGATALKIKNIPQVSLENLNFYTCDVAIELVTLVSFNARNVYTVFCNKGVKTTAAPSSPTTMLFEGCSFRINKIGMHLEDAQGVTMVGGVVESNSDTGVLISGVSGHHNFIGTWFENNTNWDLDDQTASSVYNHKNYMRGCRVGKVRFGAHAWWDIFGGKLGSITIDPNAKVVFRRVEGYDTENFKSTGVSVTVGSGGVYGSASVITSQSGLITYPRIKITWGGTFGTGETVTVKVEAVYSDGTTAYVEKSATATGSLWLTDDDILSLITQGKDIVKLNIYAKTNLASTTVTVTVDAYGKA
jgi:hypothetical protein